MIKFAQDQSGFGVDIEGCVTADDDVWEKYLTAHPEAKAYRGKRLANYALLKESFDGKVATGVGAVANTTARRSMANENEDEDEDEENEGDNEEKDGEENSDGEPATAPAAGSRSAAPAAPARATRLVTPGVTNNPVHMGKKALMLNDLAKLSAAVQTFLDRPVPMAAPRRNYLEEALGKFKKYVEAKGISKEKKLSFKTHLAAHANNSVLFLNLDDDDEIEEYIAANFSDTL